MTLPARPDEPVARRFMIAGELPLPLGEQEAKPARKDWLQCLKSLMPPMSLSWFPVQPDEPVARRLR
jgi:hypothetical protein